MKSLRANSENSLKALHNHFLDSHRDASYEDLDVAAHMLLYLDNPKQILTIALRYLTKKLDACRADAGLARPEQKLYTAQASFEKDDRGAPSMLNVTLPNQHAVLQTLWQTGQIVAVNDIKHHAGMGALNDTLLPLKAHSIMAKKLEYQGQPLGLICIDHTVRKHDWQEELGLFDAFTTKFLSPILFYSKTEQSSKITNPLTNAEQKAVYLAAQGLSYKAIAKSLNKSSRTIDNQLRSAREKLGAKNQVELIKKAQRYL